MRSLKTALLSLLVVISILLSVFSLSASAASMSVSGSGTYNKGQRVTVRINYNGGTGIYAAEFNVTYNSSILGLVAVSGADYKTISAGNIQIVDDAFKGETSSSYTLTFNTLNTGNAKVSVSGYGADSNLNPQSASGSANINVVIPEPSKNANLGSLKVSSGVLTPAFSSNTTSYTVTVKNPIDKFTLSPAVADGGASASGGGTFDLKEGDNVRTVTVTAADRKTTKTYTVTVKRLTEEETRILNEQERANDPLLVIVDGEDYHLVQDISALPLYEGFTASVVSRRDLDIGVLADNGGKYTLYYLTKDSDETKTPILFTRDSEDNFKRLPAMIINGRLYIIENKEKPNIGDGFEKTSYELDGLKVPAFVSKDSRLKDFYWFYCYFGGESEFYSFDSANLTIQRAPAFESEKVVATAKDNKLSIIETFALLKPQAKAILIAGLLLLISIVALISSLVVRSKNKIKEEPEGFFSEGAFDEVYINQNTSEEIKPTVVENPFFEELPEDEEAPDEKEETPSQENEAEDVTEEEIEEITEQDDF